MMSQHFKGCIDMRKKENYNTLKDMLDACCFLSALVYN